MIETYKILSWKYNRSATPTLPVAGPAVTRGHNLRLHKFRAKYDLRKCRILFRSDCNYSLNALNQTRID